ncbi:BCCT family transporter [Streptomyces massasporeus]
MRKNGALAWGALTGLVAAVLLMAGGLEAVRQVAIIAAFSFPFLFVMIGLCVSLVKALRAEPVDMPQPAREQERDADAAGRDADEPEPEPGQGPGVVSPGTLADSQPAGRASAEPVRFRSTP